MLKTLIVTSCTGEKKYKPENQLVQGDFENRETLPAREAELAQYASKAADLYTGMQHLRLLEGANALRDKFGSGIVDLAIVSAGYGLIAEDKQIVPYEVTFNTMSGSEIRRWSRFLNIHNDLNTMLSSYDMVLFLLGDKYLKAMELPLECSSDNQRFIVFASNTSRKMVPERPPYYFIEVGQDEAKAFSYGLVGLKGYLFKLLSQDIIASDGVLLDNIYSDPGIIVSTLEKYKKVAAKPQQIRQFEAEGQAVKANKSENTGRPVNFFIPKNDYAKNYGAPMQYFIPEWDDRVDPNYDFLSDTSIEGRDPYADDVYAHEMYQSPNYDGILVSKVIIENNKKKKAKIEQTGIHDFIRFDSTRPVMGDCGAFDYVNEYEPPFETKEILDYYQRLGFNIGVSIDHLIVGAFAKDPMERERRYKITRENAADFLAKHRGGNYTFTPSGVAQGWDPVSYRNAVAELVEMGYKHISLGGLVRTQSKDIIEILKQVSPLVTEDLQLHLFGIARLDAIPAFRQLGVTAFDSASHLRRAWLGTGSNYFTMDGRKYAAIRIPPVDGHGVRVRKMVAEGRGTIEQFRQLEEASLSALRNYDKGHLSLDETLETVLKYDELIGDGRDMHKDLYRRVLEDMPWKECDCEICKSVGVEVIVFRGNNRNRRRGFHNTYVFYRQFKKLTTGV